MVANEILEKILLLANWILPGEHPEASPALPPFRRPKAVLIIPSLFIGDNVLLIPFLRNLRENLGPVARIDVVATLAIQSLLEPLPWLNAVLPEKGHVPTRPKQFLEARGYDTVIFMRYSLYWGRAALHARIPQRVGFDLERLGIHKLRYWGRCLTHPVSSTALNDRRPQAELYLDVLRQLGLPVTETHLEYPLPPADRDQAETLLHQMGHAPKILIQTVGGSPGKRWEPENWRQLLQALDTMLAPIFISTGTLKEHEFYEELAREFPLLNLCGQTRLRETLALLRRMDLVITIDTSIAHLAALAGTPRLVVLYGPTNHHQWRPWTGPETVLKQVYVDLPCRPCPARTCEHRNCLRQLSVEQVLAAVHACLLEKPLYGNPEN